LKYVPVEVVRLFLKFNAEAVIGVETRNVTLFFSDIANFTSISERVTPQNLIGLLSEYLTSASEIILQSEGTLADYIGDAVFAFWNAPNEVPNHPNVACEAALLQQEGLKKLNAKCLDSGITGCFTQISVRMGIHTGSALCGNIGSEKRMKYTAIGDAVNLTSRLENLNKRYGTNILITEDVFLQVRQDYLCRAIDIVAVKGRRQSTCIFELVARMKDATEEQKRVSLLSQIALTCYRSRDFVACLRKLDKVEDLLPGDMALVLLKEKCQFYNNTPPPADWTGVEILTEKS